MKLLLIGMDGAYKEIFNRGFTPYIAELLQNSKAYNPTNDLISRGWLEIITGKNAKETTAMYDKPACNASYEWSINFKSSDIPESIHTSNENLWHKLNRAGWDVGIMNVPITFPAPEVQGFFVSGGGGGAPVSRSPTERFCYPQDILGDLLENDYIVDERLIELVVHQKLSTAQEIFRKMIEKNERRTINYIELAKKRPIDFGFLVFKTSSVMVESLAVVDLDLKRQGKKYNEELIQAYEEYYLHFDTCIMRLVESFPESAIGFVSDHGTVARKSSLNVNLWLELNGFQYVRYVQNYRKVIFVRLKEILPLFLKNFLKKVKTVNKATINSTFFDGHRTQAFSRTFGDWRSGIFINDKKRFGGVVDHKDIDKVASKICNDFNNSDIALENSLMAIKTSLPKNKYYPDILIDVPDGCFITDRTKSIFNQYNPTPHFDSLKSLCSTEVAAMKSTFPIFHLCKVNSTRIPDIQVNYLTDVHKLIVEYMGHNVEKK